jgi:ATP-dependent DNA helicase DinG
VRADVDRLALWAATTKIGDLGEITWSASDQAQRAVTVSGDECPGAARCPMGEPCFAERARREAQAADVVVVNLNLYGLDVASGGAILPEHDVVVIDEAHRLEDVMSDTVGLQIAAGRFASLAATLRRVVDDATVVAGVFDAGSALKEVLVPHVGRRLPSPLPVSLQDGLVAARAKVQAAQDALRSIPTELGAGLDDVKQRILRAQSMATRLQEHIDISLGKLDGSVAFVSGSPDYPRLEIAPLAVGAILDKGVWQRRTAILTSATIPSSLADNVGIAAEKAEQLDVGSPFDYATQGLLYCATHLPDPRSPAREAAVHEEIAALIRAAGGRTLALFTSWKAMDAAASAVRVVVDVPVITQRDLPKGALIEAFSADESTCLFATAGFFQGVDIPGRTLSLVIIDRIPFPRPDDPLLSARRELLGAAAFGTIDLPRASILLAQAAGRLVRTKSDHGVVAVLDPRLATASYRWRIVEALPPMRRTRHRADAEAFLRDVALQPS